MLKLSILFLLVAGYLSAGECQLAQVDWLSVTTLQSADLSNPDSLIKKNESFGCVIENKETVTVIGTLRNGDATNILIIPKGVVTAVVYLEAQKEDTNKPRVLPDATPEDVHGGNRPNDKRLV